MATIVQAHGDKGQVESEYPSFLKGHNALPRRERQACIQLAEQDYEIFESS